MYKRISVIHFCKYLLIIPVVFLLTGFSVLAVLAAGNIILGYQEVPHNTYDSFRDAVEGKAYNVNYDQYGAQCWDGVSLLWWNVTSDHRIFSTGGTIPAKNGWYIESVRNANAGTEFQLIYDKTEIKRGDMVVLNNSDTGHVAFADEDYNGTNTMTLFGQNQNGIDNFSECDFSISSFAGAFRLKKWADNEAPVILSNAVTVTDISLNGFTLKFQADDNTGITDVYAVITPIGSTGANGSNAPSQHIKGTYDKGTKTATIRVDLTKNICGISEFYTCKCFVNDENKNGPSSICIKEPFSICKVDTRGTDYFNCITDVNVYSFPKESDDLIVENYPSHTYVNGMGYLIADDEIWYRCDKNCWIKGSCLAVRHDPLAEEHRIDLYQDMPDYDFVYYCHDAKWNEKYIEASEGNDQITVTGKITSLLHFSLSDSETLAEVGTLVSFVPKENENYEIRLTEVDNHYEICIVGYVGCGGNIEIPEQIGGYPVTEITSYAFDSFESITSISIPDSVKKIGSYAFRGCSGIETLLIPPSLADLGYGAFMNCLGIIKLTIPRINNCGSNVFTGCARLTEVTMPVDLNNGQIFSNDIKTVETIRYLPGESGEMPDWDSSSTYSRLESYSRENLKHLYFEEGIEHIGNYAYRGSGYAFTDIHLPSTLKSIGNCAFYENSSLKSIEIPEGVTTIGESAFSKSGLTEVIIPEGVTYIPKDCFEYCTALEEVTLPSSLEEIRSGAFVGCTSLTALPTIPDDASVRILGGAFQGCTGITELTIPSTVEEIGSFAFSYCSGMEKLMLPQTAVYGNNAFKGCIGLKEVTMPIDLDNGQIFSNDIKSVETIHYLCGESGKMPDWDTRSTYSRLECYSRENLKHLYFEEGIEHIGTNAYRGNVYIFNDIRLPSTLKSIGNYAFYENSSLKSIEIPEGVTTIGDYAFSKSGLTEITIPESMTYIPRDCFEYCTALEEVTLPSSLTEIRSGAFVGCTSLTALPTIPDDASVRILGGAFQGCTGITELTIPSTVEEIGSFAFSYCSGMEKLMLPQTAVYGNNAFKGCIGLKEVTMPIDLDNGQIFSNDIKSVETIHYLCGESGKMPDWDTRSTYSRLECYSRENLKHLYFEEGIEHIGDHAYRGNVYIFTDIYLPSTLKSIGNYAFYENSSLKSIEIPEGVTTIGTYAFSKSGLTEVTIPESMTYIPSYCFEYCTALEEVILPSSLTEINQSAFAGCTALTTLPVIPDGASVRILSCAFSGCTGITELMIPSTVTEISDSAFASCSGMEKLTLPQTAVYGNNAFKGCTGLKEVTMPIDLDNGRIFSNDIKNVETIHYLCGESGKMPDLDSYHTLSRLEYYSRENLKHLYFEEGIEHIGDYAYSGSGYAFIDIHLPSTLKSIGNRAFYENSSLKSIEIPEGVTTIGAYAFSKSGLTEVTIPESMTYIPINCFEYCTALEEVTLPSSLTEIGHSAFAGCTALTKLPAIPDDASVRILSCAFSGCTGITELTIPSTVTEISDSAFAGCSGMEKLTLPQTAVYYNHVFYSCTGLKEVTMPVDMNSSKIFSDDIKNVETIHYLYGESGRMSNWNYNSTSRLEYWSRENLKHLYFEEGIEHIGDYAFYGSGYTFNDIHLPSTLKSIGNCAFCDNVSLTKIEIPDGVTSIGFEAFKGSGLTEVTIPENLEEISSGCFKYCAALRKVFTTHGSSLSYINSDAFNSCPEDLTFFGYSGGTAESYAIDSGYHFVALDVEWEAEMKLPAGLKTIEDEAFVNGSFQTVKIPDGIQTIGSRAFAGCENLERIIIPDSVETIAPDAFEGVDFLVVYCSAGSYAQQYAREHELVIVDD